MKDYLTVFAFDHDCNMQLIRQLYEMDNDNDKPEHARKLLTHVVAAKCLWLQRMMKKPVTVQPWPQWSTEVLREQAEKNDQAWQGFLSQLDRSMLDLEVEFKNVKGTAFRKPIGRIIDHLLLHGAHHRGQIAALFRDAGHKPPAMDFIYYE